MMTLERRLMRLGDSILAHSIIVILALAAGCDDRRSSVKSQQGRVGSAKEKSVADGKWLEYSGQTTAELIAMEKSFRIDSLVAAFQQAIDQKAARVREQNLTEEERIALAVQDLEREVNNGGYDQYFINSSEYRGIIVRALERIGCRRAATITKQAIDSLGISGLLTTAKIDQAMSKVDEKRSEILDECDHQYFANEEFIAGKLFEFIKANPGRVSVP